MIQLISAQYAAHHIPDQVMHIWEEVTHGDPLYMTIYEVSLLPLMVAFIEEYPMMLQQWYIDDSCMIGVEWRHIGILLMLIENVPHHG